MVDMITEIVKTTSLNLQLHHQVNEISLSEKISIQKDEIKTKVIALFINLFYFIFSFQTKKSNRSDIKII